MKSVNTACASSLPPFGLRPFSHPRPNSMYPPFVPLRYTSVNIDIVPVWQSSTESQSSTVIGLLGSLYAKSTIEAEFINERILCPDGVSGTTPVVLPSSPMRTIPSPPPPLEPETSQTSSS